jgi:hypothetical protein
VPEVFGDNYFIQERVREIDPALFIEMTRNGRYKVRRHGTHKDWTIMTVDRLTPQIITDLRRMDSWNHGIEDYIRALDLRDYEEQQKREREIEEMAHEASKELHRAIQYDLGVA